jgi:transcriptional regulator with XRE-family HTH domain
MGYVKSRPLDPITAHGWALGRELRKAILAADFSQQQLAAKLGYTETRVSRILTGRNDATSEEVSAVLALCGVVGEQRDFLLRMARERSMTAWDKQQQQAVLRSLRWDAIGIVECSSMILPELLWTDGYAEAVISQTVGVKLGEIDGLVGTVRSGQAVLRHDQAPRYEAVLSEATLHLRVGSRQIMAEQLHYLLDQSMRLGVTIRIVPMGAGGHAGMRGSFCLVTRRDLVVVAVEDVLNVQFVDDPDGVEVYARIVGKLRAAALTPSASRDLISSIATECYGDQVAGGPASSDVVCAGFKQRRT